MKTLNTQQNLTNKFTNLIVHTRLYRHCGQGKITERQKVPRGLDCRLQIPALQRPFVHPSYCVQVVQFNNTLVIDKYKILNSSALTSDGFSSKVMVLEEKLTRQTDSNARGGNVAGECIAKEVQNLNNHTVCQTFFQF